MTHPSPPLPERDASRQRRIVAGASAIALIAIMAVILFISMRAPLKDDIAWLMYVARRWLAGRELYVDLIEVNPPLIVWISAIPLELGRWLHIDPQTLAIPLFVGAVLACAGLAAGLLRSGPGTLAHFGPVFAITGVALLVLPAADIGQREHLLVAAFLPYLVLLARSMEGKSAPWAVQVLVAILAAIGCALKPRYVIVFVALECLALARGLRPWRLMPLTAAVTLTGYVALVAGVCPAYLRRAVPMAIALYGATDVPFTALLKDNALVISGEALALVLLLLRRRDMRAFDLMAVLVTFAVASTCVCLIDGKDWYYHRIPATVATVLALALWCSEELSRQRAPVRSALAGACLFIACFMATAIRHLEPEVMEAVSVRESTVDRLEHIIYQERARTYVAFSEWIALGFPVVNNTGVTWASRFDSMWALKGEVWRAKMDPSAPREWPIARWVAHDFIAGCPEIAVVDTRESTRYIAVLNDADPAFARAWSRYQPIARFDGLVVYKRTRGGCIDVWIAGNNGGR